LAQGRDSRLHAANDAEVEMSGAHRSSLEQVRDRRIGPPTSGLVDHRYRLGDAIGEHQSVPAHQHDAEARDPVIGLGPGRRQRGGGRVRTPGRQLGGSQRTEHLRGCGAWWRLGDGTPEVGCRHRRRSLLGGPLCAFPQLFNDSAVSGRVCLQQMRSDRIRVGTRLREDHCRAGMELRAGGRRQVAVDRGPHQRMGERQSTLVPQDLHPHERFDERGRGFRREVGERGRVPQLRSAPEDGDGARKRAGALPQRPEPAKDSSADAVGTDGGHVGRGLPRRSNAPVDQRGDELAEQKRVAIGSGVRGRREVGVGWLRQTASKAITHTGDAQITRPQRLDLTVAAEHMKEPFVGAGLAGSSRHQDENR
jgi:hypothetical protein